MLTLNVGGKEYKVKFSYNSFCDTDLMDRTTDLIKVFQGAQAQDDKDVYGMGKVRDLFVCIRDLLFVGFQKYNPVDSVQEVGNIIDEYHESGTEEDKHGILELFTTLSKELLDEGFLGEVIGLGEKEQKKGSIKAIPQDHKKKEK